jgi:hypothetical protein
LAKHRAQRALVAYREESLRKEKSREVRALGAAIAPREELAKFEKRTIEALRIGSRSAGRLRAAPEGKGQQTITDEAQTRDLCDRLLARQWRIHEPIRWQ